ncbi:MAG: hypothetical protein KGI50_07620, partial [Patescibacteria group bacterium]|nr:hypothetical protein [Patescibacteria group bacterium]
TIYGIKTEAAQMYAIAKYYMSQGMSKSEALIKADQAVHESQVSGRSDMKAAFARGGSLQKILFAFMSQVNSQAQDVAVSWDRFNALRSKETFVDAVKASTGAMVTTAIFESFNAAYNYMMAADDKERNDAALDFVVRPVEQAIPFLGFPMIRDAARTFAAASWNLYAASQGEPAPARIFESDSMAGTFVKSGYHLFSDVAHMVKDPDWISHHFFRTLGDLNSLASPFVKTPFASPLNTANKIQKKIESGE